MMEMYKQLRLPKRLYEKIYDTDEEGKILRKKKGMVHLNWSEARIFSKRIGPKYSGGIRLKGIENGWAICGYMWWWRIFFRPIFRLRYYLSKYCNCN